MSELKIHISGAEDMDYLIPDPWISVQDRLPEFNVGVLCYILKYQHGTKLQTIRVAWLVEEDVENNIKQYWLSDGCGALNVSHWMPLPDFPKEK